MTSDLVHGATKRSRVSSPESSVSSRSPADEIAAWGTQEACVRACLQVSDVRARARVRVQWQRTFVEFTTHRRHDHRHAPWDDAMSMRTKRVPGFSCQPYHPFLK